MSDKIKNALMRKAIVIDGRVDTRTAVREALKANGCGEIISCSTVEEAVSILEADPSPSLIVTELAPSEKLNATDLLKAKLEHQELADVQIIVTIAEDQHWSVPLIFELGALSYHAKPFTTASLTTQFEALAAKLERPANALVIAAADFLREYLTEAEKAEELIAMEEALIRACPDEDEAFLKLAEAQYMCGRENDAKKTLWQARFLGKQLEIGVKQLEDMVHGQEDIELSNSQFAEAFGVGNAIVIEPDDSARQQVEEILKSIGVEKVLSFSDGEEASLCIASSKKEPGIVITEWKIPGLSSVALIQRIRDQGFHNVPIIVTSSLVGKVDKPLLSELSIAEVSEKPLSNENFMRSLMMTIRQERYPSSQQVIVRKFRQASTAGDAQAAVALMRSLKELSNHSKGMATVMEAECAYLQGDYLEAQQKATEAIREGMGDDVVAVTLLGKIFLETGDNEAAIKCLNRAQGFSSQNLERLCLLAEAQSEQGDHDKAQENIDAAKAIDEQSDKVLASEAKVALNAGDAERVRDAMEKLGSVTGLVSYSNTRAISLVREGKFEEGVELYATAMSALGESRKKERNRILYNLGLAHVKNNNLGEAVSTLEKIKIEASPELEKKVKSLINRSLKAIETNTSVQLNTVERKPEAEKVGRPSSSYLKPGEACLHHIYYISGDLDEKSAALLANNYTYKKVKAAG